MPTKISLALGPRGPLSRQMAWGCFTSNLALPGAGSLMAGRRVGYAQVALALVGFGLSLFFGGRVLTWLLAHYRQYFQEPDRYLGELWGPMKWALLGIGIFALAWVWAMVTSLLIVTQPPAPAPDPANVPPRIVPPRL